MTEHELKQLKADLAGDELALEFLAHPERFEPTPFAIAAICDRAYGLLDDWLCIPKEIRCAMATARLNARHIRNARVEIKWAYSSTAGCPCAVMTTFAECLVRGPRGGEEWRQFDSGGGIAFVTSSFIQRKK